jgi:hypothetical protein
MDEALNAFLAASDEDTDERLAHLLADQASPIIRKVIASRLRGASNDADDIHAQALLQLMVRLRQGKIDRTLIGIDAFAAYVAAAAHHGCDHHLRRKYPLRWRLRNRLRYVLEHDRTFAIWKSAQATWRCGRRGWEAHPPGVIPSPESVAGVEPRQVKAFLQLAFQRSGGPLD